MTFEILHQAKMLGDYTRFDLLTDRPLHTKTSITRPKDTLTRPKRTASETGRSEEVRAGGEQLSCSLGSRVKEPPGGAFQSPAAGIR